MCAPNSTPVTTRRLIWFTVGPALPMAAVIAALYVLAIVYLRHQPSPRTYVPPHSDLLHWATLAAVSLSGVASTWLWPPSIRIPTAVLAQPLSATLGEALQLLRSGLVGTMACVVILIEVAGLVASLVTLPTCHYEMCSGVLASRLSVLALVAAFGSVVGLAVTRLLLRSLSAP